MLKLILTSLSLVVIFLLLYLRAERRWGGKPPATPGC
jgi:hypothetical protein